jgi:hypothetical protein
MVYCLHIHKFDNDVALFALNCHECYDLEYFMLRFTLYGRYKHLLVGNLYKVRPSVYVFSVEARPVSIRIRVLIWRKVLSVLSV